AAVLAAARALPLPAAERHYHTAAAADPLDPVPLAEMVERYLQEPRPEAIDDMLAALNGAIQRDPRRIGLFRMRMRLYDLRYQLTGAKRDLHDAVESARHAAALYPASPDEHLGLAAMLARAAAATGSIEWQKEARAEYARALALDAARPGTDEVRKWSSRRRAEVQAAM